MKTAVLATPMLAAGATTRAQAPSSQASQTLPSAASPAQSIGILALPRNEQPSDDQLKDENQCQEPAKQENGVDPQDAPPPTKSADQKAAEQKAAADNAPKAKGGRVRGAARGAAVGVLALAPSPGMPEPEREPPLVLRRARSEAPHTNAGPTPLQQEAAANTAAQQQALEHQANAAHAQSIDAFKRAFSACMDSRGYSVK